MAHRVLPKNKNKNYKSLPFVFNWSAVRSMIEYFTSSEVKLPILSSSPAVSAASNYSLQFNFIFLLFGSQNIELIWSQSL